MILGINPIGLKDAYANYEQQVINHSKINHAYCIENPKRYTGYSSACWGLTASDIPNNGYAANAPGNDIGVITPTAAISSLPFTPTESMNALRFFITSWVINYGGLMDFMMLLHFMIYGLLTLLWPLIKVPLLL